ncbi:hypothetical protein NX02_09410 [Sphingomonas sanxanigenens DSM 19645 = NX02]|uniref:Uncharacterized protein n=1 Tax=Sphingomonas sanxanigenens DSM 19645 = NX02 TaxID=1123269 RepID=W0ABC2_9SPHN|nr:hypothetical protein NX02_09410 [Sphingomonas sanxanigenens DSM 19645 = NX02]
MVSGPRCECQGHDITNFEKLHLVGGGFDGAGEPDVGYVQRRHADHTEQPSDILFGAVLGLVI